MKERFDVTVEPADGSTEAQKTAVITGFGGGPDGR